MAMIKCPRCELNYIQDAERICTVCRRELHGDEERLEGSGICPECGEHPVAQGEELCAFCLKEASRQEGVEEEAFVEENPTLLTAASAMDEIEIDDTVTAEEFPEIASEFDDAEKSGEAEGEIVLEDADAAIPDIDDEDGEEDE